MLSMELDTLAVGKVPDKVADMGLASNSHLNNHYHIAGSFSIRLRS
jgi:hypothetical protein